MCDIDGDFDGDDFIEDDHFDEPSIDDFDLLIVMGGPMSVYNYEEYPWLKDEKWFIESAIENKVVELDL